VGTGKNGGARVGVGQFYSIIAIVIAVPIIIFLTSTLVFIEEEQFNVQDKIVADRLHLYEKSIEDDFHLGMEISTRRAVISMIDFVIQNSTFLTNSFETYLELLHNGTIDGEQQFLMINNTLTEWKGRILNVSTGFKADINWSGPVGNFNRTFILGDYGIFIRVEDRFSNAVISKVNERKEFLLNLTGLEDPLFALGTSGLVRRTMFMFPYNVWSQKFNGINATENFTANVTFVNELMADPNLILAIDSFNNVNDWGWGCVIAETGTPDSSQDCIVELSPGFTVDSMRVLIEDNDNYSVIYVDANTDSAWYIPIVEGIEKGYYYDIDGPNLFDHIQGTTNTGNRQFQTYINAQDLENAGIPVDYSTSHIAIGYLLGFKSTNAYTARGFPSYFRTDNLSATWFGFFELLNR